MTRPPGRKWTWTWNLYYMPEYISIFSPQSTIYKGLQPDEGLSNDLHEWAHRYHRLGTVALLMATHPRLGRESLLRTLPVDVFRDIIEQAETNPHTEKVFAWLESEWPTE